MRRGGWGGEKHCFRYLESRLRSIAASAYCLHKAGHNAKERILGGFRIVKKIDERRIYTLLLVIINATW
jgi:hypothetical protein